jgi:hypothetical protein
MTPRTVILGSSSLRKTFGPSWTHLDALENSVSFLQRCSPAPAWDCHANRAGVVVADESTPDSPRFCVRMCRSSTAMIPTPATTPHLPTKTFRCTQTSKKYPTHPLKKATTPTSRSDASDPPQSLQHLRLHLRQVPLGPGAHRIPAYEGAMWGRSRCIRRNSN